MPPLRLKILETLPGEIAHHYEPGSDFMLFSRANRFWGRAAGHSFAFELPMSRRRRLQALTRIGRRLTRTDKSAATFNMARDGIVILYLGQVFFFDLTQHYLLCTSQLRQCRNTLHGGFAVTTTGIYFGEYGDNRLRNPVPLWVSRDDGRSWEIAFEFPAGSIKHVHGVHTDPHSESLWIPTGDFPGECGVFEMPGGDPELMIRHGNGQQEWRPVSMFFEQDRIIWGMDSQLQTCRLQTMDRATGALTAGQAFPGPVWYAKRLTGGTGLLQSSVEPGPGSHSCHAHLFASDDLQNWKEIARFRKDIWPMIFKFGVIAFADGIQSEEDFVIFGEALSGFDGCIFRAALQ